METKTQHGYLLLADISGYTAYLADTELEHAHEILSELLELVVERFKSTLTLAKLEGDAVFAYASDSQVPRGEILLELIDSVYIAFRNRRDGAHRRTTCTCAACRNIPTLDLKFLLHYGAYILQNVSGITELAGSDVNLVHRLLKNHISEATGWRAYALFSAAALQHVAVWPAQLHEQLEAYEHLGEVVTYSQDMHPRYQAFTEARRVFITPDESDLVIVQDLPASPAVVWDWINDPLKRVQWDDLDEVRAILRPGGRTGVGARNHCLHGRTVAVEDVLDWHPFNYFTVRICRQRICVSRTCQFSALPQGHTRLSTNFVVEVPFLPNWLVRRLAKPFLEKFIHIPKTRQHMAHLVTQQALLASGPA